MHGWEGKTRTGWGVCVVDSGQAGGNYFAPTRIRIVDMDRMGEKPGGELERAV